MNRTIILILGAVALAVGVGVGVFAGSMASGTTSPSPAAQASGSPAPSSSGPAASPSPLAPGASPAGPTAAPTATPAPTPSPAPTPVVYLASLTGEPVAKAVANRRVIAVMIDDLSAARPQSGLSSADVVWHAPAEGGIPRYMALFQTEYPREIGPVRSSRLYYVGWAAEWASVYVHAGGSPQAIAYLNSAKGRGGVLYNADWSPNLYRIPTRSSPHNLYTNRRGLQAIPASVNAKAVKGQLPVWTFAPDAPLEERPQGGRIVVPYRYNQVTYQYDRKSNTYKRSVSVEGKQFDAATDPEVRLAPRNVIVMKATFIPTGDKKGRLDGQITGTGPAWISTNGVTIKGEWRKKSFRAPTRFFDRNGKEVVLTAGQTFINVVTRTTRVTVEDGEVPAP
jgi:hypothetical protein